MVGSEKGGTLQDKHLLRFVPSTPRAIAISGGVKGCSADDVLQKSDQKDFGNECGIHGEANTLRYPARVDCDGNRGSRDAGVDSQCAARTMRNLGHIYTLGGKLARGSNERFVK